MKKIKIIISSILMLCLLSSCYASDSEPYGESKVLSFVGEQCLNEEYELVEVNRICDDPTNDEYTFVTDRGLKFTANSYLDFVQIDATVSSGCTKELKCSYVDAVHDLYRDQVSQIFDDYVYIDCFDDIQDITNKIIQSNEIYYQEAAINGENFLIENPLCMVYIRTYDIDGNEIKCTNIEINGNDNYEELYNIIKTDYLQLVFDQDVIDSSVSQSELDTVHVKYLENIYLNNEELFYDTEYFEDADFALSTERYKKVWYDYDLDNYLICCDIGKIMSGSSVLIINEYVTKLNGTYGLEEKSSFFNDTVYVSSWNIGDHTWQMETKFDDIITDFKIYKDGVALDIDYYTYLEKEEINCTFVVALTLQDFSQLLSLNYTIDESNTSLFFQSYE